MQHEDVRLQGDSNAPVEACLACASGSSVGRGYILASHSAHARHASTVLTPFASRALYDILDPLSQ